jgi:hypothetical protein
VSNVSAGGVDDMHRRWGIVRGEGLDARLLEQRVDRGGVAAAWLPKLA